ncbi:MAG: oxidoreductase, partial [Pseudomonadota bacterium]
RFARYAMSKLANLLFVYELQRRLDAIGDKTLSVACHPGVSDTELPRYLPGPMRAMIPAARNIMPVQSAAMGALPTLRAATDPGVKGAQYYGPAKAFELVGPPVRVRSSWASRNKHTAKRLWNLSIDLTGVDPGLTPV